MSAKLQKYLNVCLPIMRLWGWRVTIGPPCDGDWAEIKVTKAQHSASLHLGPEFHLGSEMERRETIAHELLHCYTEPVFHAVMGTVAPYLPAPALTVLASLMEDHFDLLADELSRVVAPHLPEVPND